MALHRHGAPAGAEVRLRGRLRVRRVQRALDAADPANALPITGVFDGRTNGRDAEGGPDEGQAARLRRAPMQVLTSAKLQAGKHSETYRRSSSDAATVVDFP